MKLQATVFKGLMESELSLFMSKVKTKLREIRNGLTFAQCLILFLAGGTYFVEGSLAASCAATPWAPSNMPPREVVRPWSRTLEASTLRVHTVGQEGWELASTTSWSTATVGRATATSSPQTST